MANKNNSTRGKKPVKVNFGISWIYILLFIGIGWMFFNQNGANPQKEEWDEVKTQWLAGDIKEVVFVRNEFEGHVTIKPDKLAQYESKFGGVVPKKSPHFIFLVSGSFNAEEMFGELNEQLPENEKVKVVIENQENFWGMLEWLIFPLLLIFMWFFMFRGMNRNMGGGSGGPGGIFNVGKATGKLAEKDSIKVTFKDFYGFVCGIISKDYDVESIFIDGVLSDVCKSKEDLVGILSKLEYLSDKFKVDFYLNISCEDNNVPDTIRKYVV